MRFGLHGLGIGSGSRPEIIDATAQQAERRGFATLWCGEHVVMVDDSSSTYPYSDDGRIAVPATADWLDPFTCLTYAAAVTSTIHLATGVVLLPEHNPVIMAKQAASLDRLSGGRLRLGIGIGWSEDEFDALGIPFVGRAARTADYVHAIRTLWRDDPATYASEHVSFRTIRVNPKPTQTHLPILVGGNSDRALRRVAAWGDGWYGFNLDTVSTVRDRIHLLTRFCTDAGRDIADLHLAVALRTPARADIAELSDLGVTELVLVDMPPESPDECIGWVDRLADRWFT
ncbi:LLM class F420-dependent oxidoreductase [Nocardia africana]|uniref:Pyrimidine monooxygenase RutA n=1 Tax=Nocardia africana TaxID=134964 RepID=A0A378X2C2_9NOCA|nr:LLM class F420-dependent oxidoreductase [Nocardia africana]MCC3317006.1 LLM class F420-dependent oxidoreductase [Nocardia africana]SUA47736.1 Pyrimidine monooxygenase RutA [Nocardia africana]